MEPTTLLPVISLLLLVSVEYGGWSLLGFLTGRGQLGEFREQFFRAGHAHAGVLLASALACLLPLPRPYRVLDRGPVASRIAPAVGYHGPVWWLLHPSRPRAEEPKLSGIDRDTNRRPAPCSGADRLGHRPTLVKDG